MTPTVRLLLFGIGLIGLSHGARAGTIPDRFTFARSGEGRWSVEAYTEVDGFSIDGVSDEIPKVRDIACTIAANGLHVYLTRSGMLRLDVRGDNAVDQDEGNFGTLNVIGLDLGSRHYAARSVEVGHARRKFSDVTYPDPEAGSIVISSFIGYLAVRRRADGPWLKLDALLDELVAAPRMTVHYRVSGQEPGGSLMRKVVVPLQGLGTAIRWCETQFVSPEAFRLHGVGRQAVAGGRGVPSTMR